MSITRAEFIRDGARALSGVALLSSLPLSAQEAPKPQSRTASDSHRYDLRDFVRWIKEELEPAVRLPGPAGSYAREFGAKIPELYGISDMACILYTIGALRPTEAERTGWAQVFQSFQNPDTGFLVEKNPSHDILHNTAFSLAAMRLLELAPDRIPRISADYADIKTFLGSLEWDKKVYVESHKGAGVGSIYALCPSLGTPDWFKEYFSFCDSMFDPQNGMMGRNKPKAGDSDQIGGTFHYSFLYQYFNRRLPYPERRIDAVLGLQQSDGYWDPKNHLWMTIDAMYLMTRTLRYCDYRNDDVKASLRKAMDALMKDVYSPTGRKETFTGRLAVHSVTAAISIAAELQQFFGSEEIVTDWPLHLVLDRRPFI